MKYLESINFDPVKINLFDIKTSEGMKQVALLNEEARHAQIGFDEQIAEEIKDIKVEIVEKAVKERDAAQETSRVLLIENKQLKDFLKEKGLIDECMNIIDGGES